MRAWALAAVLGAGLTLAGVAAAETWTDPNGNIVLNTPRGWTVRPQQMSGGTAVLAFTASSDCYFFGVPNAASANVSVHAVQHTTDPLPASAWVSSVQAIPDFVEGGTPTVASQSVDTSGFWPVQRARLTSGSRTIHGAITVRPGYELRGFCSGSEASYDAILNGIGHPNDAAWQAAPTTPPADQTPAAQQAPAPAQESNADHHERRERGFTRGSSNGAAQSGM